MSTYDFPIFILPYLKLFKDKHFDLTEQNFAHERSVQLASNEKRVCFTSEELAVCLCQIVRVRQKT